MGSITAKEYLDSIEANKPIGKYKNKKIKVDGINFDSMKEAAYYGKLKMIKASGEILDFKRQIRFPLKINEVLITTYVADFVLYYAGGKMVVVDVKSEFTKKLPVYRIKKNLMRAIYQIEIKET